MANEVLGRTAVLSVVADPGKSGATPVAVSNVTDMSISANAEEIDVTGYDSGGVKDFVKGTRDLTMDFSFIFEDAVNAPQKDIINSWNNFNAVGAADATARV